MSQVRAEDSRMHAQIDYAAALDAVRDRLAAFGPEDQRFLEEVAALIAAA